MLIVTTDGIEGKRIVEYFGIASGDAIVGANAVVAVDLDYEVVGESMLMVSANGTAVRVE